MVVSDESLLRKTACTVFLWVDTDLCLSVSADSRLSTMTQAQNAEDGAEYRVRCTVCDYTALAVSKVHAHAVGRKHYHAEGHPVGCEEVDGE